MSKGNRNIKEREQIAEIFSAAIDENPEQTLEDLAEIVNSELGFSPHKTTIQLILTRLGKSAKRVTRWEDAE